MRFADLHTHTAYSDGTFTPEELVRRAKTAGCAALAVTDHDTVGGIEEALHAGAQQDVEVIAGIELTSEHAGREVHLLGYCIDYQDAALRAVLSELQQRRVERVYAMSRRLKSEMGVELRPESVLRLAGNGTVGRLHVARAMVAEKIVGTTQEAFRTYIGDSCPGYVAGFRLGPAEAVGLIDRCGGVAVVAHPYMLRDDALLDELIRLGCRGIEAYYPEHSQGETNYYCAYARTHGLLVTGGSDCHGVAKPEVRIGAVKLAYEHVDALKAAAKGSGV
jgi:hypothetical protein